MKIIANKKAVQKIVISILIVILTTFCIPTQSNADFGGKLMSPLVALVTAILDGVQHLAEWAMLGETTGFMKDIDSNAYKKTGLTNDEGRTIKVEQKLDGTFFGLDAVNIPVIAYTPEEIFSNRVPALDINFINPSIIKSADGKHDEEIKKMNIAYQLQSIIATWYNAITILAMVGLLSVLLYLGIRMLLTSIAADKAKYKQMLFDWIVAMCLLFTLHFIMSFALTLSETVTSMISPGIQSSVKVVTTQNSEIPDFETNLMGYVRLMIQCSDLLDKLAFLALYLMLVIYTIRFTWVYLKRVVNMAFLTLIAPMVALTYPIDKVGDGKAQAFNMWLKEFTYNTLIQPLHLILYSVLLGTAVQVAVMNPLYAIVALGFIIAAEKLMKQMFGFGKASGGTIGSLAGAAGVTALAGSMLNKTAQKGIAGKGNNGKVRTREIPQREGKDAGANAPFGAFKGKSADQVIASGAKFPTPEKEDLKKLSPEEQEKLKKQKGAPKGENNAELEELEQKLASYDESDPYFMDPEHQELQNRYQDLREQENMPEEDEQEEMPIDTPIDVPSPDEYDNPFNYTGPLEPDSFFDVVGRDISNFGDRQRDRLASAGAGFKSLFTAEGKRNIKNKIGQSVNSAAIGAWKAAPTVLYKGARGTLKTASRLALAGTMGAAALAIGATTGDGDKAASMALGAAGIGFASGDNVFEATVGKAMKDKSIRDAYGAGKYGNRTDARNARADKEYLKSDKFDDFYEKYYKGKKDNFTGKQYTKKQLQEAALSYRKSGITSEKDLRKAIKLEEQYRKASGGKLSEEDARAQVQNIVQTYNEMDTQDRRAFTNKEAREEYIQNTAGMIQGKSKKDNRLMAEQLFQGLVDFRNS